MDTQKIIDDVTGTEDSDPSDPAGVGKLATQVDIVSSGNVSWKLDRKQMENKDSDTYNRHCYSDPLRLRGGGDDDDDKGNVVDMTNDEGTSGEMGTTVGGLKCGPPSPEVQSAKQSKMPKSADCKELNDLLGWLEQTFMQEKGKKLGVQISERMMSKLYRLRTVTTSLTQDNFRLQGELKGKDDTQRTSLTCFIEKLNAKNAEANSLKAQIEALKSSTPVETHRVCLSQHRSLSRHMQKRQRLILNPWWQMRLHLRQRKALKRSSSKRAETSRQRRAS